MVIMRGCCLEFHVALKDVEGTSSVVHCFYVVGAHDYNG